MLEILLPSKLVASGLLFMDGLNSLFCLVRKEDDNFRMNQSQCRV